MSRNLHPLENHLNLIVSWTFTASDKTCPLEVYEFRSDQGHLNVQPEEKHFERLGSVVGEHLLGFHGVSKVIRTVILVDLQFLDIPTREI